jgi:DNA-binding NtrC family response regulator
MTDDLSVILIVEDENDHYLLVERALSSLAAPNRLQRARSIKEARRFIAEETPAVVITDWKLPDGEGIELIDRDEAGACSYPVIVMTSHGNEARAVEAMKLGALDYIVKSGEALSAMAQSVRRVLREWHHIAARRKAEQEREQVILELRKALEQVTALRGLLPICAYCKKIRNDDGYWQQIEAYVSEHSLAEFSHGVCPNCAREQYPKYFKDT